MKTVVIMPGGFHPFHAGHYSLYNDAKKAFPGADVYVAATNDTSTRPFPFAVKEKLAQLAGVDAGRFVQVKSPFRAEEITQKYDPDNTVLIFVRSEKDATTPPRPGGIKKDGSPSYLQPMGQDLKPMTQHAYMAYLPTVEFGPGITSASEIRAAWPRLDDRRKTAMVMSLYPRTQKNPRLAQTVVKMLDTAIGTENVAEGATVTRIDSKPIEDFSSGLKAYKHTDDWSQSGLDTGDDSYWKNKNLKTKTTKGLFAGDPRRTALYATGNAHETRYVEFTLDGQPIVYFDKKDLPAMRSRKTYLTVFDASNFKQLPTGEWFSQNPGKPIKQTPIDDPFKYIADQGWIVRVTDDLDKVFKQVKKMHQAGKIAQYGAEGMNEGRSDMVKMLDAAIGTELNEQPNQAGVGANVQAAVANTQPQTAAATTTTAAAPRPSVGTTQTAAPKSSVGSTKPAVAQTTAPAATPATTTAAAMQPNSNIVNLAKRLGVDPRRLQGELQNMQEDYLDEKRS